jgi:hypothetical protein
MTSRFLSALSASVLLAVFPALAIDRNQRDDFEDGTAMGWVEGPSSPNDPINVPTGGPSGTGDAFLQNQSTGTGSTGSRMVMFNSSTWSGDWIAAGIVSLRGQMLNLGSGPLNMRIALQGAGAQRYGSAAAVILPADGVWHDVSFALADLVPIGATTPLSQVLSSVNVLRVLSAAAGPAWEGDRVAAVLGMDNLRAIPEIDANIDGDGLPGPVALAAGDAVRLDLSLAVGAQDGTPADWWVVADTPFGMFHYDLGLDAWVPGLATTFQGPLADVVRSLPPAGLPAGQFRVYFGVDTVQNNALDMGAAGFDWIDFEVSGTE